jgi:AbrB family looped-hinge helix DNA binding protein
MRTTIDRAGRLVIPKALRDEVGLVPGEVELTTDGAGIRIEAVAHRGTRERRGRRVIEPGTPLTDDDVRSLRLLDQR